MMASEDEAERDRGERKESCEQIYFTVCPRPALWKCRLLTDSELRPSRLMPGITT